MKFKVIYLFIYLLNNAMKIYLKEWSLKKKEEK